MKLALLALALAACSSCYLKQYPVTPKVVESATYMLIAGDGFEGVQGTAWAVNDRTVVTAGHMCAGFAAFDLQTSTGRHIPARVIEWEHSDTNGDYDLCVLRTEAPLYNSLIIADYMPRVGTPIDYVGYPNSQFVVSHGKYLGDVDPHGQKNHHVISAACDHGASGSAVFTDRGVFGVLVRLRSDATEPSGAQGCDVVPLGELRSLLDDAHVNYITTPDPLPPDCLGNQILSVDMQSCHDPVHDE